MKPSKLKRQCAAASASLLLSLAVLAPQGRVEAAVPQVETGSVGGQGRPRDIPDRWKGLIGEYALDRDTVIVLERSGRLRVLAGDGRFYTLREVGADTFETEGQASVLDSLLTFRRGHRGQARRFESRRGEFFRLFMSGGNETAFRIKPLQPISVLREQALRAKPPVERGNFLEPALVEVIKLDSTIRLDIRYAGRNNFMGTVFYSQARAFLQRPAAEALVRVHRRLKQLGYGLLIHDAYRPWYVTKMFWDATPNQQKVFVADPSKGSRHNRGCAVDVSLFDLRTGEPIEMVSGYDEFSRRAFLDYPGGTSLQRWQRDLLRRAMEAEGFSVYEWEWWHFDHKDWRNYPIGTKPFEMIR